MSEIKGVIRANPTKNKRKFTFPWDAPRNNSVDPRTSGKLRNPSARKVRIAIMLFATVVADSILSSNGRIKLTLACTNI